MNHTSGQSSVSDDDDDTLANIPPGQGGLIRNPAKNDVLSGRGGRVNAHEGNIRFRNLVGELKHEYVSKSTKKLDKAHIASKIVRRIRKLNPPGRFLKVDGESKLWIEIGDDKARKKAGQALREDAPEVRSGLDKEKDEIDQKEQVKKLLETMATQMPYGFPPGYFPNMSMANMQNMANPYAMAAPFAAANMVGGTAPIYPAMMQPDAAAAAMFFQQQQQAQASAAFSPYGVFNPAMGQQPQAFMQHQPTTTVPDTQSPVKNDPPPESITMPSMAKIPGIQPSNPNPPKVVSNEGKIVAPFGNVPSHSFAALTSKKEQAVQPPVTTKSTLWGASREQYRGGNSDNEDEDEDDIDDESEQKTESEDMSLVSQMQNSHVSEPSEKEENIWAPNRKGQWLGGKSAGGGGGGDSAVGSSAVGSAVTPNASNVTSGETKHPEQVVVKHRNDRDIFDTSNQPLPRVLEEGNTAGPNQEDVFDGVSMKSVNTFNCSEMNDLVSLSGNSFQALMNGDDFSVSQRSIISELSSDLLSLDTKNQQQIYAEAVRQVNVQYQAFFHKPMNPVEHQQAQQMYFEAVKNTHAQMLAQSRK